MDLYVSGYEYSINESIQMHHKTAILAKRRLTNPDSLFDINDKDSKRNWLGTTTLEIEKSKRKAEILQEVLKIYNSEKTIEMD